jgi:ureidoglycolate hydrolase
MKIKVDVLSAKKFQPYGDVLSETKDQPMADDDVITYYGQISKIAFGKLVSTGFLLGHKRALVTNKLERHAKTPEVLVALENDAIILAALSEPDGDSVKDISAFYVKQGQAVVLNKRTWHWTPFPTTAETCKFLVMFNDQTEFEDLTIKDLEEVIEIV